MHRIVWFASALAVYPLLADEPTKKRETVVVTGTYDPLPLEEADRPVRSIDVRSISLVSNTFADLLKLDSSLDFRQRAPNGVQGDLSIRGGGFGQTLILLDGLRLNDVQSGHHNLDIPAPLEAISSIEILKGSGSTLYGSDAVGGVVNFITRAPESSEIRLRTAVGNFGTNQQRADLSYAASRWSEQLTFSRDFSTGFIPNRDYRNLSLASRTSMTTGWERQRSPLQITIVLSAPSSSTGTSIRGSGPGHGSPPRGSLWAARPMRPSHTGGTPTSLSFTAIGRPSSRIVMPLKAIRPPFAAAKTWREHKALLRRRNVPGFDREQQSRRAWPHPSRAVRRSGCSRLRRFSFSIGLRDEIYGSFNHELSPSYRRRILARARFEASRKCKPRFPASLRTPISTITIPANVGSPTLRPERAWSYEGGSIGMREVDCAPVSRSFNAASETASTTFAHPTDIWRATNFQRLAFTGVEAEVAFRPAASQEIELAVHRLPRRAERIDRLQSKYVFNYPVHSGIVFSGRAFRPRAVARTRVGVLQRYQREPYGLWDLYGAWNRSRLRPFFN